MCIQNVPYVIKNITFIDLREKIVEFNFQSRNVPLRIDCLFARKRI